MAAAVSEGIGRRIRERREELGLTQLGLANALPGSVGSDQVSRWERGIHKPRDEQLEQIAEVLEVEFGYFMSDGPSRSVGKNNVVELSRLDRLEAQQAQILEALERIESVAGANRQVLSELLATLAEQAAGDAARAATQAAGGSAEGAAGRGRRGRRKEADGS